MECLVILRTRSSSMRGLSGVIKELVMACCSRKQHTVQKVVAHRAGSQGPEATQDPK